MQASFDGVNLTADGLELVSSLRIDGRQVNQEAQLLRTPTVSLFSRGNRSTLIEFSVARIFGTLAEAEAFVHSHFDDLAEQGDLVFTLSGDGTKTYADAVIEACTPVQTGLSVTVTYAFRAARPS